ncbi:uncharacterized protein MKZ38_008450 [Zalerion maritima]|uniref:Nuclear envelope protein n=1 Tax=Zalerion maritima TaxID=339359 RepID=A0AAD5RH38_9PEZI|nr:uncharacterized protein MKZ38_008450 [Zalerion maritima]
MSTSKIVARRVPYKDFLQPALQRRFVLASALILVISYFEAVLVGSWHSWLWAWFPIIRTFFFFICAFSIILLRVAHYHVGIRTASSPIQVAQNALFAAKSWEILATYVVFGWFFSQFYLLYAADRLGLQWILHQAGDRARLNEKPIFFSTYFVTLAVVHAVHHIAADVDQLPLGTITPANLVSRINSKLPNIATKAAVATVAALMLHLLCYSLFMRSSAWGWALWSLRPFFNLPKSNMLPSIYPYHLWLFSRMVYVGWLLSFLWIAGNFGFSVLMKAEPLKHGKPITSESKDPNGSLLNGLKSKKFSVKCFAMWELAFVARDFEDRRKTIFDDIDRLDGPMWSQVYQVCLGVVTGVQQNMNNVGKQPEGPKVEEAKKEEARPKVAVPPSARNVCIQRPERDDIVTHVQKELKSISQSPGKTPLHELSPIARKAITDAKNKYLTMEQQEAMTRDGINSAVKTRVTQLLNHPIGVLIRRDFGQRLAAVVFDSEEVEISLYVNAVNVLTKLSVNSLAEDQYGHVQRDVASIIRTFTTTLNKLEAFATAFPTHWLDGNAERECRQVNELVGALRLGLRELLDAFGEFAEDLRLSRADMRQAMDATLEPQK